MSKYSVGLRNVGSYQISGRPFITGSDMLTATNIIRSGEEKNVSFPSVTKKMTIWNLSNNQAGQLRVHFVPSGTIANHPSSRHYFELAPSSSFTLSAKSKEVFLSAVGGDVYWKIYASLTSIPAARMYALTGSGISS